MIILNNTALSSITMEKGRISVLQLALLTVTAVIATADVFLPAFVAQESKADSWLAVIIGTALSLVVLNIALWLGLKFPDKTIIQYSRDILGNFLGSVVGLIILFYFLSLSWKVTRELGEIFVIAFNPDAPMIVYCVFVVLVSAYTVSNGLEVICRVNELILPVGGFVLLVIGILNIPNLDLKNFLPVLENGWYQPFKGAILIQSWIIEAFFILQLIPFVKEKDKIRKYSCISVMLLAFSLEMGVLTIGIFGPLTGKLLFPALEYVRFVKLGTYIQNLDVFIMGVWITGIFVKITIFYYCSVLTASQIFKFKSYKTLVLPLGILIVTFSIVTSKTIMEFTKLLHYIFPFYSFSVTFFIPLLLLTVNFLKRQIGGNTEAK